MSMSGQQRFKALLFDFDDTLVPEYEVAHATVDEVCAEVVSTHAVDLDLPSTLRATSLKTIYEHPAGETALRLLGPESGMWLADELMWDDKAPMHELTTQLGDFRRAVWEKTFEAIGVSDADLAHELSGRLPALVKQRQVPYEDAQSVLGTLGQWHPMAIMTNGEPVLQAHKVEKSGLKHHFDHVVLCHEHGGKPRPAPFVHALELLGRRPDEVAMVGNSLANDIAGARNAGIYSIWMNRGPQNYWDESDVEPNATVTRLSELLDVI